MPIVHNFPSVNNIAEPVIIQAFIPKAAIETLNKFVLCRLIWLGKPQLHSMLKGQLIERAVGKFRVLIGSYRHRIGTNSTMLSRICLTCTPEILKATVTVRHSFVK